MIVNAVYNSLSLEQAMCVKFICAYMYAALQAATILVAMVSENKIW